MTSRIFKSIFFTAATLILVLAVGISVTAYRGFDKAARADVEEKCATELEKYEAGDISALTSNTLVISETGEMLLGYTEDFDTAELVAARGGEVGIDIRNEGGRTILCAMRAADGAIIRISDNYGAKIEPFFELLYFVLLLSLFALLADAAVAFVLSKGITKPLSELNRDKPNAAAVYPELRQTAERLSSQSYQISKQSTQIKTRENELNSITSNMSEGMIVINAHTLILSCNESAKRILGIGASTPRGILQVRNTPEFRDAIFNALRGKNGHDTIKTEDKFYSILVTPVINDGEVEGAVIVIIDDTEKEHREGLRREFTSNISHELKTPLTSISGFAELIRDGIAQGEDAKRFAANIHKEAGRLIVLVGDIIKLSMLDGGEVDVGDEIDLYELAGGVIERLSNVAESAGITLSLDGDAALIHGNERTVEEMIYNLVDNGIKYNREGGFVKLRVFSDFGDAVLSVSDNGIGIPADKQDRVFERFYRVDKSHSKAIGGTGLGLSIVKHAAARHGAKITLKSEEGIGTEITVRFPLPI